MHATALDVRVIKVEHTLLQGLPVIKAKVRSMRSKQIPNPRMHRVMIMPVTRKSDNIVSTRSKIWISCDCEFHCFYCEVALYRQGASDIIFSNGKYPHVTNPRCAPVVCKHAIALFKKLKNKRWKLV